MAIMPPQPNKITPCILCDSSNHRIIHRREYWQYLRCEYCGLIFLHPRPTNKELRLRYQRYLPSQIDEIGKWEFMVKPVVLNAADLIEAQNRTEDVKLLDVGCGHGFFLNEMKSRGWKVEGIELSSEGRKYASEHYGVEIHDKELERVAFATDSFDVITLFYVIEHVIDPLSLMNEVSRILKPDGLVLLRWPHSTPIVKVLGPLSKRLDLYHTPYHLYDFSPKTIDMLLVSAKFKEIKTIIGGYTRPSGITARWAALLFGFFGEALYYFTGSKILLPGISKTTFAYKSKAEQMSF